MNKATVQIKKTCYLSESHKEGRWFISNVEGEHSFLFI